ncbi:MAG: hypothetical protein ABSF31_13665, partial [Steroidobacteraceae bacterium]
LKAPQDMSRLFVKRNDCTGTDTGERPQRGNVTHRGIESCSAFLLLKMRCMIQYLAELRFLSVVFRRCRCRYNHSA